MLPHQRAHTCCNDLSDLTQSFREGLVSLLGFIELPLEPINLLCLMYGHLWYPLHPLGLIDQVLQFLPILLNFLLMGLALLLQKLQLTLVALIRAIGGWADEAWNRAWMPIIVAGIERKRRRRRELVRRFRQSLAIGDDRAGLEFSNAADEVS